MVKSCLINAFLYTVLTDGSGSFDDLLRGVCIRSTYGKRLNILSVLGFRTIGQKEKGL